MEFTITLAIIIITCIVSFTAFNSEKIINDLIFWPPMIKEKKQFYRFITSGFIHADIMHLAFNMIALYFFSRALIIDGMSLEDYFVFKIGKLGFILFYLIAIIVSEVPSYIRHRDNYQYRSLGASGAVSSIIFASILFDPWNVIGVFFIPMPAIVFAVLYIGFTIYMDRRGGDNVNHSAHLWGAIYGVLATIALDPRVINIFLEQLKHPRFLFIINS
ncbi:MAG: rhomboid family intramembrane serine protease [Chitinophagaceae bacterium]|nr:rhomboid family intramembrane serine protease [Chitinophagaceae bacterium]